MGGEQRKCLKYRLEAEAFRRSAPSQMEDGQPPLQQYTATDWGFEYIRNLNGEIAVEHQERQKNEQDVDDLDALVMEIVPYSMKHSADIDAVDLLCEVDMVEHLREHAGAENFERITSYLSALANLASSQEEQAKLLTVAFDIFRDKGKHVSAFLIALRLNCMSKLELSFSGCEEYRARLQMALFATRMLWSDSFEWDQRGFLNRVASGDLLSEQFLTYAKELDMLEPKSPEQVYKTHLEERRTGVVVDSAKQNLAGTFVNAFVNHGFCTDTLMLHESSEWVFRNKDAGMTAAAASLGLLFRWNVDDGLSSIDRYQWASDAHIKAGAYMGFGLVSAGTRNDDDPTMTLLSAALESSNAHERTGAALGLGFAHIGNPKIDLLEILVPVILDTTYGSEPSAMASVALGLAFQSTCDVGAAEAILQTLIERQAVDGALDGAMPAFFSVGLALLFFTKREAAEATLAALECIQHPIGKFTQVMVEGLAYATTCDMLKVQAFLQYCTESPPEVPQQEPPPGETQEAAKERENEAARRAAWAASPLSNFQGLAALCIPLCVLGDDIGTNMAFRMTDRFLQYATIQVRRVIPLLCGLLSLSNPRPDVVDLLSKLSHDGDPEVALHAILCLGLVGAGTNNSRIAGMFRQLAAYYSRDQTAVFVIRIAQGLLHAGKGLVTMSPLFANRQVVDRAALSSLVVAFVAFMHTQHTILGRFPHLLYFLVPAITPRFLMTVDEKLQPVPVKVRVGKAVDSVGQAGRPKKVTGFQTHASPVVLAHEDRAELATEEYCATSELLEGVVVVAPNADYSPDEEAP